MLTVVALALAFAAQDPAAAPSAPEANSAAALQPMEGRTLVDRRRRIALWIRAGMRDAWLTRDEGRAAFRELRAIREQEERWRGVENRTLTAVERAELSGRLDTLAQSLRWKREKEGGGHRRKH